MSRPVLFLILISALLSNHLAFAQSISKEELKSLKKELKALSKDPLKYKQMKEEDIDLNRYINDRENRVSDLNFMNKQLNQNLANKNQEVDQLGIMIKEFDHNNILTSPPMDSGFAQVDSLNVQPEAKGLVFKVQIGAYKQLKVAKKLEPKMNFTVEEADGYTKYLLGKFKSYEEAKKFSNFLNKKGGQAFVVGYQDNQRLNSLKGIVKTSL